MFSLKQNALPSLPSVPFQKKSFTERTYETCETCSHNAPNYNIFKCEIEIYPSKRQLNVTY